jgi:hypothetical protein
MATVFSRDAWRCVWHMIQVECHLDLLATYVCLELCAYTLFVCRTTWSMDGVSILLLGSVWRYCFCHYQLGIALLKMITIDVSNLLNV